MGRSYGEDEDEIEQVEGKDKRWKNESYFGEDVEGKEMTK